MANNELFDDKSARFIAKQLNTAPSSLTRFVQKLGFAGFPDFKSAYLKELAYLNSHFSEINPNYPFDCKPRPKAS